MRLMPGGTWHTTVYFYDALKRVIATSVPYTDHNGVVRAAITEIYYDANGNKAKTIDANHTMLPDAEQKCYEAGYSATNLVLWEKDPEGAMTSYTYDVAGNRTSMTDPRGNATPDIANDYTIWYIYDDLYRLVKGILPDETPPVDPIDDPEDNPVVVLEYDARGNNTKRIEPNGAEITYQYYARNLLKLVTTNGDGKTYTVSHEYDKGGNLMKTTDMRNQVTAYTYDALNRLEKVTGVCQDICRKNLKNMYRFYEIKSSCSWGGSLRRSGLSHASSLNDQFRVLPDHRSG